MDEIVPQKIPVNEPEIPISEEPQTIKISIAFPVITWSFLHLFLFAPILIVIFFTKFENNFYLTISIVLSIILGYITLRLIKNISGNEKHWIIAAGIAPLLYVSVGIYYALTVYNGVIERTQQLSADSAMTTAELTNRVVFLGTIQDPLKFALYCYAAFQIPIFFAVIFKREKKLGHFGFYLLNIILLGFAFLITRLLINSSLRFIATFSV